MKIILNPIGKRQDKKVFSYYLTGLEMMGKMDDVPEA